MNELVEIHEMFEEKFTDHKERTVSGVKLTYVSIDQILQRLNKVHECSFTWDFTNVTYEIICSRSECENKEKDKNAGKELKYVIVKGTLLFKSINGKITISRDGVGADKWLYYNKYGYLVDDLDKGIKTAYAEAIKKAAYTTGIALYLWDEDERKLIEDEKKETKNKKFNKPTKEKVEEFSEQQLNKAKEVKTKFNITDNINKYVAYWGEKTKNNCVSWKDITPKNIDAFCEYILKNGKDVVPF